MICPNCGNKIADDKLLCEVCGAEINFVPDFEPEIEQSINESLSDISDYVETPDYFPEGEEPVFGYYDENGNFVETPGYFDESGNFVELTGFYDEFGNFIETIPVVDENGNEVYVPGYFDENGEPVFLDPYDGGEYQDFADELYPDYFLTRGVEGDDVRRFQRFLLKICQYDKSIPGVRVNGVFDELTENSVKKLQEDYGFEVNGIVGPLLWRKVVELSKR